MSTVPAPDRLRAHARVAEVRPRIDACLAARRGDGHDPRELVAVVDAPNTLGRMAPTAPPLVLVVPRDAACRMAWVPAWRRVELADRSRRPPRGELDVVVRLPDGAVDHVRIPIPR